MQLTKEQWSKIIAALLVCALAILSAFGYDVIVDQPREQAIAQEALQPDWLQPAGIGTRGTGYNTACYLEQGGAQLTCDSPGVIQMNTGATLDLNAGTLQFEGATPDGYETSLGVVEPTADHPILLPNLTGTVLLTSTPKVLVFGTNTITTTLAVSHGLTDVTQVFCSLAQDSEANAATCSATISGGTATIKVWKADGVTAGSVGKQVSWMVVGTP